MNKNTPQDLKKIFELMQKDVAMSHHLSDTYLELIVDIICGITENCESIHEDGTAQWKGFKCIRNGLRDLIKNK